MNYKERTFFPIMLLHGYRYAVTFHLTARLLNKVVTKWEVGSISGMQYI